MKISASVKFLTERNTLFRCPTQLQLTLIKQCTHVKSLRACSPKQYTRSTQVPKNVDFPQRSAAAHGNYKHTTAVTIMTTRNQSLMLQCKGSQTLHLQISHKIPAPDQATLTSTPSRSLFTKPPPAFRARKTEVIGHCITEVTTLLPPTTTCYDKTTH